MKVFITGIESFLGNFLVKSLNENNIDYLGIDINKKNSSTIKFDINDPSLAKIIPKDCDAIIHLAAVSSANDFKKNAVKAYKINIDGTINLIKAAAEKKVKQIIFASSEWVYGEGKSQTKNESSLIEFNKLSSEYALSKAIGENILNFYCSMNNISCTILRFGIIYGPRTNKKNWSAVESILRNLIIDGKKIEVGSLKTARRFIYVSDVCDGITKSIGRKGIEIFNLTGDKLITLKNIIDEGCKILKLKTEVIEKNKDNFNIRDPNNELFKKMTGWKPKHSFDSGVKKVINSFNK